MWAIYSFDLLGHRRRLGGNCGGSKGKYVVTKNRNHRTLPHWGYWHLIYSNLIPFQFVISPGISLLQVLLLLLYERCLAHPPSVPSGLVSPHSTGGIIDLWEDCFSNWESQYLYFGSKFYQDLSRVKLAMHREGVVPVVKWTTEICGQ
jgi:hypothetical protein